MVTISFTMKVFRLDSANVLPTHHFEWPLWRCQWSGNVIFIFRLDSANGARPEPPLLNFEASKNFGFVRSSQVRWWGDWGGWVTVFRTVKSAFHFHFYHLIHSCTFLGLATVTTLLTEHEREVQHQQQGGGFFILLASKVFCFSKISWKMQVDAAAEQGFKGEGILSGDPSCRGFLVIISKIQLMSQCIIGCY